MTKQELFNSFLNDLVEILNHTPDKNERRYWHQLFGTVVNGEMSKYDNQSHVYLISAWLKGYERGAKA